MENKIIAVDFDGTLCENKWPEIGTPNMDMIKYLKSQRKNGDKLILWTCRIGEMLENAIKWCADRGLEFDAVNENLPEIIEAFGTDTRKIFADAYIDDRNTTPIPDERERARFGLRLCRVDGRFGYFHGLEQLSQPIEPSPMVGGHPGGVLSYVMGIVEFETGLIKRVDLGRIVFCDNIHDLLRGLNDYESE